MDTTQPRPLSLMPSQWLVGDRIPHPDLGVREGGWVTITAHRANNQAGNRFRVAWTADDGTTGGGLVENSTTWSTIRTVGS